MRDQTGLGLPDRNQKDESPVSAVGVAVKSATFHLN